MRSDYWMLFVIFIATFNVFVETGPVGQKPACPIEMCGCQKDCSNADYGIYASCKGCNKYAECVPIPGTDISQLYDRPCPVGTAYDPYAYKPEKGLYIPCSAQAGLKCKTSTDKPGTCPPPFGSGICLEQCSGDFSCPGNQKCCSNGCGNVCTIPNSSGPATSPVTSPQTSPTPRQCPYGEKCCLYNEYQCKSQGPGLYAKCGTCGKYFSCPGSQQKGFVLSCPGGTKFDFQTQVCVHGNCNEGPQPEPTYPPPSPTTTYSKGTTCLNWQTEWRSCCITDCWGRPDGNYQSCKGCNKYVSCANGRITDNRPCATPSQYWDDVLKKCVDESQTCYPQCEHHRDECCDAPAGKCVDLDKGFQCQCSPGYTGDGIICKPTGCVGFTCNGQNEECVVIDGGPKCECEDGYQRETPYGPCVNKNDCLPTNPCLYGRCQDLVNDYKCNCVPGYTGRNCDININDCKTDSCLNYGTCKDGVDSYTCMCTPRYEGDKCEIDKCSRLQCEPYGKCIQTGTGVTCDCDSGYYYDTSTYTCENIDDCKIQPSGNSPCKYGRCVDKVNDYECICAPDYQGRNCDEKIDNCKPNPCKNDGTCIDGENAYTCQCTVRYYGDTCEKDKCDDLGCGAGSYCTVEDYVVKCVCKDGYVLDTSANTFTCIDPCAGDKCGYGECSPTPYRDFPYTCECEDGYFLNPETNECGDPCSVVQCGSGSCIPSSWSYTCKCDENSYFDTDSKMCKNPCDPIDCGIGYCEVKDNPENAGDYECKCAKNYVFDDTKSKCVDPCQGVECGTGGMCKRPEGTCNCKPGYTLNTVDNKCEDVCATVECGDYGTCQRPTGICKCTNGYVLNSADNTCEDPCQGVYCGVDGAGTCMRPSGECKCNPGYEPDPDTNTCIEIDECASNPCKYGTCMDKVNGYKCVCEENYEGTNCDQIKDPCFNVDCDGHGKCQDDHNGGYYCECKEGFKGTPPYGQGCVDIDECKDHPEVCSDLSSSCKNNYGGYECFCDNPLNSGLQLEVLFNEYCSSPKRCEKLYCSALGKDPVTCKVKHLGRSYDKPVLAKLIGKGCENPGDYTYNKVERELTVKPGCCAQFLFCDCDGLSGEDLKLCKQKERTKKPIHH